MASGPISAAIDELVAIESTIHPASLHGYRWWRPDMTLPAIYNWLTPADTEADDVPVCRVVDWLRVTCSIAVHPQAIAGEGDLLEIEEYLDLALDVLDPVIYGDAPLGQRLARRRGFRTVLGPELGGIEPLTLELPLEIRIDRNIID